MIAHHLAAGRRRRGRGRALPRRRRSRAAAVRERRGARPLPRRARPRRSRRRRRCTRRSAISRRCWRLRRALASYETAAALARAGARPAIEHRLGLLHLRRGEWELADGALAAALDGLEPARPLRARLPTAASPPTAAGDAERAPELAASALALAEEADDRRALAQAHNILGMLAAQPRRPGRGGQASRAQPRARRVDCATPAPSRPRSTTSRSRSRARRRDRARDRADAAALALCAALGRPPPRGGAPQQPRRPAPRRRPRGRGDGRAEARGRDLRRGRRATGKLEPEIWKLTDW